MPRFYAFRVNLTEVFYLLYLLKLNFYGMAAEVIVWLQMNKILVIIDFICAIGPLIHYEVRRKNEIERLSIW